MLRVPFRFVLPALLALLAPATAWSDIYRWTDAQGNTVISNVPPPALNKMKDVELLVKEPPRPAQRAVTPTERVLLDRIDRLERQVQAQQYPPPQYAPPAPPAPYAPYYPGDYSAGLPPPPPDYYGSAYPGYYPGYYPATSFVVFPARPFVRTRGFAANRGGFVRGGAVHRGRR